MSGQPLIQVNHLKKYFKAGPKAVLKAVDDISFSIEKGETLGMVGESGCGKTTVGRTLLQLYEPDAGEILFKGKNIAGCSRKEKKQLTREMQMIFQDPYASLSGFKTVGDIIGEGLDIHKIYRKREERQDRIYELLEMVGLHREHYNRFPHEFSGGQRQRIGIARALALNPEFIVCDEAISALDVSIQAQVMNMLIKFQKEMDLTYLFISHDLSMVRHISDKIAVMYLGTMVEYGDMEEVYNHPAHPYTQGLLEAVPIADPDYERSNPHHIMAGEVPSPINPKPGCRFCGRCQRATDICSQEMPPLTEVAKGHLAACHHLK
ncbi:ABC transporter ATP-binding protein [Murimonas intestini]|uniref:Oligopeptide transport system ATP-binding protein n=1 Tax=Murimonas intestini TaxID=1337051 RepID=A0AB73T5X3_9FIRM|nr:ABC transporter ATP-binding protein [Murimonas intestini]MCR1842210.1 ABC transporter ATP-binding protein [Murimonas intestini]MCR1864945.1 ABC transporter ATP-binding protein [Murimonas intestini]MCR1884273.1 ABC transporter ATP-binding protein [Murimonas intestini]